MQNFTYTYYVCMYYIMHSNYDINYMYITNIRVYIYIACIYIYHILNSLSCYIDKQICTNSHTMCLHAHHGLLYLVMCVCTLWRHFMCMICSCMLYLYIYYMYQYIHCIYIYIYIYMHITFVYEFVYMLAHCRVHSFFCSCTHVCMCVPPAHTHSYYIRES